MLRNLSGLKGDTIKTAEGEVGKVRDVYFDDSDWVVRYFVVSAEPWLGRQQVLLSPEAVSETDTHAHSLKANLSMEEIRNSPSVSEELPVSRQAQRKLAEHYGWAVHWNPHGTPTMAGFKHAEKHAAAPGGNSGNSAVRSAKEVTGYGIMAIDGSIGHVEDFIFDESWNIRYVAVDTRNWLPRRKVLIAPHWIELVSWAERIVCVELSQKTIRQSPEYDPTAPINREYETKLYDYYGRPKYWA